MNLEKIEQILASSQQSDWIRNQHAGKFTYKHDLFLNIKREDLDFHETIDDAWASYGGIKAISREYIVQYGVSFIQSRHLISVDGHRVSLPVPLSFSDLRVSPAAVNFAKVVDFSGKVEEYLKTSQITIDSSL